LSILVTISGPPGSGTTTAAERVGAALGLDLLLGGQVFRAMAVEHGMDLASFGRYAADHPEVDLELDRRLAERAKQGGVVIESRLAGWIALNEGIPGVRVGLTCSDEVRAERVAAREKISPEQALEENAAREKTEVDRYLALYGVDITDLSYYDLVLDSGRNGPDAVADRILALVADRQR
jgi:predicted cytidylate kinase